MRVLALDTTTIAGSVAIAEDGRVIDEQPGDATRTHGERLPGELLAILERHQWRLGDVDLFAVACGPGAFTGLRIGIATIQGLALALQRKVVPISALDALAWTVIAADAAGANGQPLVAGIDAHRGEIYAAAYAPPVDAAARQRLIETGSLAVLESPTVGTPADVIQTWPALATGGFRVVGDGAIAHRSAIQALRPDAIVLESVPMIAGAVAVMATVRARQGGAVPPHDVRPFYLRRPDAERDRDRRSAR